MSDPSHNADSGSVTPDHDIAWAAEVLASTRRKLRSGFHYSGMHMKLRTTDYLHPNHRGLEVEGDYITVGDLCEVSEILTKHLAHNGRGET